jgi:hypothetical protein
MGDINTDTKRFNKKLFQYIIECIINSASLKLYQ